MTPMTKETHFFFQLKDVPRFLVWTGYCLRLYIASHKKFTNTALNSSFRKAQDKWSLCNRMLKNMDKPYNPPSKVFTKWSRHHWLFTIKMQNPQLLSVVQSPFDNPPYAKRWRLYIFTTIPFEPNTANYT